MDKTKSWLKILPLIFLVVFIPACSSTNETTGPEITDAINADTEASSMFSSLNLLKKAEIGTGARPEVVATDDRVFVVYLDLAFSPPTFSVKVFDKEMDTELDYKVLVSASAEYGKPTDIRVASDGQYLYAFYETVNADNGKAYLWGAKYGLDDSFDRIAYTSDPIAVGPLESASQPGDELVNDPIPLIGPDSVFVITRLEQSSFSQEEPMIYIVREFTNDLKTKLSEFALDLSSVAGGAGRQAGAIYYNGYYYMLVPTTEKSGDYFEAMVTPSELLLVKLDQDWKIIEYKTISQEPDNANFATGFQACNDYFFVTYKQGYQEASGWTFVSPIKVYDQDLNLVFFEIVKEGASGEPLKSSLEIVDDRVYIGHAAGAGPAPPGAPRSASTEPQTVEIYIYEVNWQ